MAGLAEVCTHVASILFWVKITIEMRDGQSVTDKKAYWVPPSNPSNLVPKKCVDIDFSAPDRKKKRLENSIFNELDKSPPTTPKSISVPLPSPSSIEFLFENLDKCETKGGILRILPIYSKKYSPVSGKLPQPLTELYDENSRKLNFTELSSFIANDIIPNIIISSEEAKAVLIKTTKQSQSQSWHLFRQGRITASVMKAVCRTNVNNPSLSLIKRICYQSKFRNEATDWGLKKENVAREKYKQEMSDHANFHVKESGLILNPQYPFLGASPDGVVSDDCCGVGCLEIKCPHTFRKLSIDAMTKADTCLKKDENGNTQLKTNHEYYYQVQTQLLVTNHEYCDFYVWLENDSFLTRIEPDIEIFDEILSKSKPFFEKALLPELISKYYTLPSSNKDQQVDGCCTCKLPESEDDLIFCCDKGCLIKSFHMKCVRVKRVPKGKWYCPDCKRSRETKKMERKKQQQNK